ncbi:UNVERIFIED_CONTAM: hypothetical protein B566_EDAN019507, partial [Ephemera danica]
MATPHEETRKTSYEDLRKSLRRSRGGFAAFLTRLCNAVNDGTSEFDEVLAEGHKQRIQAALLEYRQAHQALMAHDTDTDAELDISQMVEVEFNVAETLRFLDQPKICWMMAEESSKITSPQSQQSKTDGLLDVISPPVSDAIHGNYSSLHLPKLALPEFYGAYEKWATFKEQWIRLVVENPLVHGNQGQLIQYLSMALKGPASAIIENTALTADNYNLVWQRLIKRYENHSHLVELYVQGVHMAPEVKSNDSASMICLAEKLEGALRGLEGLGCTQEQQAAVWYLYVVQAKLDNNTRDLWEQSKSLNDMELPTASNFVKFLYTRARQIENMNAKVVLSHDFKLKFMGAKVSSSTHPNKPIRTHLTETKPMPPATNPPSKSSSSKFSVFACNHCGGKHSVTNCAEFIKMTVAQRRTIVFDKHLCENCMWSGHKASNCPNSRRCLVCQQPHHTLLHLDQLCSVDSLHTSASINPSTIQLSSLPFSNWNLKGKNNNVIMAKILLDTGSEVSLLSQALYTQLSDIYTEKQINPPIIVQGIGSDFSYAKRMITISQNINGECFKVDFLIIGRVGKGDYDGILSSHETLRILNALKTPESVCYNIQIQESSFEFRDAPLEHLLAHFWRIDQVPAHTALSAYENYAIQHFNENVKREPGKRFCVALPLISPPSSLGNSYPLALSRLYSVERKMKKDKIYCARYHEFMADYLRRGHMEQVPDEETKQRVNVYFLPYHGVVKEGSSTTKLRVVFDATARPPNGKSLNDILPNTFIEQESLVAILLRFRLFKVSISADIARMFRQIDLEPKQCNLQRILWRFNSNEEPQQYRLRTVTFGMSVSPFLAIRSLRFLGHEVSKSDTEVSNAILMEFYADNWLASYPDLDSAVQVVKRVVACLKGACFELRKFASNMKQILEVVEPSQREMDPMLLDSESKTVLSALGARWDPVTDTLGYLCQLPNIPCQFTKRELLSETARIFDPLGWLTPATIMLRMIMQHIWRDYPSLTWDSELPDALKTDWIAARSQLKNSAEIIKTRWIGIQPNDFVELHTFTDASESAYGAVIYARYNSSLTGKIAVELMASRGRVAPISVQTIPRLELMGALLGAQLTLQVSKDIARCCYLALFTCFSTRAVHIEVAADLSGPTLLQVIIRFISRRGKPVQIVSDNGTNMQYASQALKPIKAPTIGDIVLLFQENIPPMSWPLARITNIFPGSDNIPRVAEIKMGQNTYIRPLNKLVVLPVDTQGHTPGGMLNN